MNKLWPGVVLFCTAILTFTRPETVLLSMQKGAASALELCCVLLPVYALWGGVLELLSCSGAERKLNGIISPITDRLFSKESENARKAINMTFMANCLGLGGAATPLAIKATAMMDDGTERATKSQKLFAAINATSLSLIPTTMISLRTAHGSASAGDVVLPTMIASIVATVLATLIIFVFQK